MDIRITPTKLRGKLRIPDSKSHAHRLIIAAALAGGRATTNDVSEDIAATSACVDALVASKNDTNKPYLYCGESGSTLRFLLPLSVVAARGAVFFGKGKLPQRPLSPLDREMKRHGAKVISAIASDLAEEGGQERICETIGNLTAGEYELPGNVSSQFLTGLLLALPLLTGDSKINVSPPIESQGYVRLTLKVLQDFGVRVLYEEKEDGGVAFYIKGKQKFHATSVLSPEGDWSQAAFWIVANRLGSQIELTGLDEASAQGDKRIKDIVSQEHEPAGSLIIDAGPIPDLVPVLAVHAAARKGTCIIENATRLRIKESDRIRTTCAMINDLGGDAHEIKDGHGEDAILIHGGGIKGGTVDGAGDHRIIMAAAVSAIAAKDSVVIKGAEAVAKSYPTFFNEYERLGGMIEKENI